MLSLSKRFASTTVKVFRYNPADSKPARFDAFRIDTKECGPMVLDALLKIKNEMDQTLAFRRSCREGICGSCAMNIDGKNGLACITPLSSSGSVTIRPLPQTFVLRDLVPDLTNFYQHYETIQPWLKGTEGDTSQAENLQSPEDRKRLDGQYEWWNPETFLGPQALLAAHRWVTDSRDKSTEARLAALNDTMKLYRCHNIQNCTDACPKSLKPSVAIENLKKMIEEKVPEPNA